MLARALFAYHRRAVHLPRVHRVAAAFARQIVRADSLLDVGCGDGSVARELARLVGARRVRGVDVKVRPGAAIEVEAYDGVRLPFGEGEVEAVLLGDVLHHAADPCAVLRESLRVASRLVVVKDHFRFGGLSNALLLAMDVVGNAEARVVVRGTYFSQADWRQLLERSGARQTGLEWPLRIHDLPWRLVTQDRLQFVARLERAAGKG